MSANLRVDVIVNNYNYGRFVCAAVESALAQTYSEVKVIVVDDGSTDDSREVLRAYDGRIELVLKENGGQASAVNAGFARSEGDVVIFLDADDMLRPEAAARVASTFAADSQVVKVQYRMEVIDAAGRATGALKPPPHLPLPAGDLTRAELVFPFDLAWAATSANAFRSAALRRIMPIPEHDFARCADWYLVHLTALLGPVVSLADVAASQRIHGANDHEPHGTTLDLDHVRRTVVYSATTMRALERLTDELGLERPYNRVLSVSDLANRLISLKLEPELHPIAGDRAWRLVLDGARAADRRSDVLWPMKFLLIAWLVVMAVAPDAVARHIAAYLVFPQRRPRLNRVLGCLHKRTDAARGERPVHTSDTVARPR